MKSILSMVFVVIIFINAPASAEFVGNLEFKPPGCKTKGECELVYDFGYIDPNRLGWQAKAGLKTDGASIPEWAQSIIGGPWEESFTRAAVIHDHYCIRTVRSRSSTHRMFYNALIESGVNREKALTMYYAVNVGSHMWISLMEGKKCQGISNCIQNVDGSLQIPNTVIKQNEAGDLQAYRAPRFEHPEIANDILEVSKIIQKGLVTSPEEIDAMALNRHPHDFFLKNGDSILYQGPSSRYPIQ